MRFRPSAPILGTLTMVLLFGHVPSTALAANWIYSRLPDAPSPRDAHTAIYDPVGQRMLVYGGRTNKTLGIVSYPEDTLLQLTLGEPPVWTAFRGAGPSPGRRWAHTAIYDPVGQRMLAFGGNGGAGLSDELWELSLSGTPTWTMITPNGTAPTARAGHCAIYDPIRHRMLVCGGGHDELWELSLGGTPTWSPLAPTGTSPGANVTTAVYDPAGDRMLVFVSGYPSSRTMALSLDPPLAWTLIEPTGPSDPGRGGEGIFDPLGNGFVLLGGYYTQYDPLFGTYRSAPASDSWLSLSGSPQWEDIGHVGTTGNSAIYDAARDRIIYYGGETIGTLSGERSYPLAYAISNPTATAVLVSLAEAAAAPDRVRLIWQTSDAVDAVLLRRVGEQAWMTLATIVPDAQGRIVYEDTDVIGGRRYGYRIDVRGRGGDHRLDETWVDVPASLSFELDGAMPNPATAEVMISFTLPRAGAARVDLFDSGGRRVVHRTLELTAGPHRLEAAGAGSLAPGVYLLRLTHDGESRTRLVSVIR